MSEETIIDGVDISECEYIFAQKNCALLDQEYCEERPDCYFKQLKRLQEENEELKQERLEVARLFDKTCRCDDLQEDTAKCQYFNDDCISIRHCMKKFRSLKDSYKQALEEIRNIAKYSIMHNSNLNSNYQIILQNINEVFSNE